MLGAERMVQPGRGLEWHAGGGARAEEPQEIGRGGERLRRHAAGPDLGPRAIPRDGGHERGGIGGDGDLHVGLRPARHGVEQAVDRADRIRPGLDLWVL